jgi:hypothetical protein
LRVCGNRERPAAGVSPPEQGAHFFAEDQAGPEDRDGEEDHGPHAEGGGDVFAGADQLEEFVDGFGDRIEVGALGQHQAVRHLQHAEGEGQQRARDQVGHDERQGDAAQGGEQARAQIGRRLLEGDRGLLQARHCGTHHVGQAADAVGDDQEQRGVGAHIEQVLPERRLLDPRPVAELGADGEIAEGHDEAGHGEGQHGQGVQHAAERDVERTTTKAMAMPSTVLNITASDA